MMFDLYKYKDNIAVIDDAGRTLTYLNLKDDGDKISSHIEKGRLLFCLCENTIGAFVGYIAFLNHSIPSVLLNGIKDYDLLKRMVEIYEPGYIWTPNRRISEFDFGEVICSYEDYSLIRLPYKNYKFNPELLLLLTTSGSTGSPKLVRLTEKNIKSNAESIAEYLNINEKERPITSLPMYYSFGMSVINSHIIRGATILLTEYGVLQRQFWNFFKEQKATSIAGVPYTYEMLKRLRFFRMDLPYLKTMIQAGGKLNASIAKEYIDDAEQKGRKFIVMYGQTEASPRISYLPFDKAQEKYASIGIPIPGGKLSILDANNNEIKEPETDGELIYEGPNVCLGYAESKDDLIKGDENHGILHTGDIARKDKDGFFYITGRMKRFVKIWGNRCNLDATEQLVKAITTNCACVGVDDKITVFVTEAGLEDNIKNFLSEKMNLNIRAFDVKAIDTIPTKDSGKIDYMQLQKLVL